MSKLVRVSASRNVRRVGLRRSACFSRRSPATLVPPERRAPTRADGEATRRGAAAVERAALRRALASLAVFPLAPRIFGNTANRSSPWLGRSSSRCLPGVLQRSSRLGSPPLARHGLRSVRHPADLVVRDLRRSRAAGTLRGTPGSNTLLLAVGTVLASWIGNDRGLHGAGAPLLRVLRRSIYRQQRLARSHR